MFDVLRKYCSENGPVQYDKDLSVEISGTGAWKSICVIKNDTGEVLEEKKFYKPEFNTIFKVKENKIQYFCRLFHFLINSINLLKKFHEKFI